jgi:hypothetical protein
MDEAVFVVDLDESHRWFLGVNDYASIAGSSWLSRTKNAIVIITSKGSFDDDLHSFFEHSVSRCPRCSGRAIKPAMAK